MGTDYNSGGFTQGSDGAVFGDPSSDPGSIQDYNTWDWKQIMAAINGMSAGVDNAANESHARAVADPQSLQDAADIFYQVQQVLSGVAQALTDQAKALAGENGPWKGDAADSFLTMMETFSKQVNATALVLSGGTSGTDSIPQQLADNAVNLANAQTKIADIDTYYANEAIKTGLQPMSNGLIPISQRPQLVEWMNEDMRAVLKSLAGEYQVTIDSVHSPGAINSPLGNGGSNQPNVPNDQPTFKDQPLPSPNPDTNGLPTSGPAFRTRMPADTLRSTAGGLPPLSNAALSRYGGGLGTGTGPGGLGTGTGPGGLGGLNPAALDRALNPHAYTGGLGTGGTGRVGGLDPLALGAASLLPRAYGGGLGTGGTGSLGNGLSTENPSAWKDALKGSAYPGATGVGGTGKLGGLNKLGTGAGLPGALKNTNLESGLPTEAGAAYPGLTGTGGTGSAANGEGMPYLPGMGGAASGAQNAHNGERSDASGLLDATGTPWTGSTDLGTELGHHLGTTPGGEGLTLPGGLTADNLPATSENAAATGEGMPYLPGMGGAASGAQNAHNGERSDASGLLDATGTPWTGSTDLGTELGHHLGTTPGGEGLTLPGGLTADNLPATSENAATGEGMPYLPGMGGTASGAQNSHNGERSDASGLLDATGTPWTGSTDLGTELGHHLGTTPGGEGLTLPGENAATGEALTGENAAAGEALTGEGMPYLPGMGGTASRAQNTHNGERSDASGLLAASAEPWTATAATGEPMAGAAGTASGAAGLDLPVEPHTSGLAAAAAPGGPAAAYAVPGGPATAGAAEPVVGRTVTAPMAEEGLTAGGTTAGEVAGAAAGEVAAGEPMPYLPGAGAAAPGAPAREAGERSDASGLLVPDAGPWTGEPEPAEPTAATAPGGEPLVLPGLPPLTRPAGRDAGPDAPAGAGSTVAEESAGWAETDGADPVDEETAFAEVELAEPSGAAAPGPQVADPEDDAAAWGTAGAAFVPLLFRVDADEERDVQAPGYTAAEEGTWGEQRPAPTAGPAEEEPRFATWRPNRAASLTGPAESTVVYRNSAASSFADDEYVPEHETEEPDAEEAAEEAPSRGAADLLVQASDTWGVAADDDFGAII